MSMRRILHLFILMVLCHYSEAQNVPFNKNFFPGKEKELESIKSEIKKGDKLFAEAGVSYVKAIPHYQKAYAFNPSNTVLNYKMGVCYLKGKIDIKSISFFESAIRHDAWISESKEIKKLMPYAYYSNHLFFLLGQAYHLNLQWDKAISMYEKFKKSLHKDDIIYFNEEIDKRVYECKQGKILLRDPLSVKFKNLGSVVNSKYSDYGAFFTTDMSRMYYTSRRQKKDKDKLSKVDNQYFEDIYATIKLNDSWVRSKNMGRPINKKGHDATAGISNDGQKIFIYRNNKKGDKGGDLFFSSLKGDKWKKPKKLSGVINTKYQETTASLNFDEKVLYFVSARKGGHGGRDIYRCFLNEKGKWYGAENLGPKINSPFDEDFVFIHPDGKSMYFSSKGHNSMGGYDIFKSEILDDGSFSSPVNIGYPLNTPSDDVEFRLNAKGDFGIYTSVKPGGFGEKDIYEVKFLGKGKPMLLSTEEQLLSGKNEIIQEVYVEPSVDVPQNDVTILKGRIIDDKTKQALEASIEIVDNNTNKVIANFTSNIKTGKYLVCLPSGINYGISIAAPDHLFHSENVDIPQATGYQEIIKEIGLKSLEVGSKVVLKNIFFDYNKSSIKSSSLPELERLVELLITEMGVKIEISGHTDNIGSGSYNQKLSEERAKSVVDFLVELGISPERLKYAGYGFDRPIADNSTEEGRKQNRRTEFSIIEK